MSRYPIRTLLPGLLLATAPLHAQLSVNTALSPTTLVNDILVGQGISVSNVTFNGATLSTPHDQISAFNGASSNIGLPQGIVLCTGRTTMVQGPNNNPTMTSAAAAPVNTLDPDLGMLMPQLRSLAVLEFDFVPTSDSISFRFVFGSEEYNEHVCTQFNDVFGFFLSGPGINGTYTNGAVNLGTVPNSPVPITINSVNNGSPGAFSTGPGICNAFAPGWQNNSIYYVDNAGGTTVQLDGFTVPIVTGARVRCGETYHIKIALAHAGDNNLDSAVFIEGGSFSVDEDLTITATVPQADGSLTEGCGEAVLTLQRLTSYRDAVVHLGLTGSGAGTDDISALPTSITIPSGSSSIQVPFSAVRDALAEGSETLTITAALELPCGDLFHDTLTLLLLDHVPIELETMDLVLACDVDSALLQVTTAGGLGDMTVTWSTGATGHTTLVDGLTNATYTVRATDECPEWTERTVRISSGCELMVPNVFTPNGDGSNDAWVITGAGRDPAAVRVFNRWGQVVYEAARYGNNWRANGLPDGTYFYEVKGRDMDEPLHGTLTILGTGRR